jgi:hypothetical protein
MSVGFLDGGFEFRGTDRNVAFGISEAEREVELTKMRMSIYTNFDHGTVLGLPEIAIVV